MVKEDLVKYKDKIPKDEIPRDKKEQTSLGVTTDSKEYESVILFFSFDIVNSSAYKTINYYGWSIVLHEIIKKLRDRVSDVMTRAEVWRVLGDEVIFIITIYEIESIFEYVNSIYDILITFCNDMEGDKFFDEMAGMPPQSIGLMKLQHVVSLQASAWIAAVTDRNRVSEEGEIVFAENIYEIFEENKYNRFYEFIGQDIDAGFRISKQTREKRLVLSFELACLLLDQEKDNQNDYEKRLYIVTFRSLKGVWGGRLYPIIWYYDEKKNDGKNFEDSFSYDAIEQDEIYKEYLGEKRSGIRISKDDNICHVLKKIEFDRKIEYKIKHIKGVIENSHGKGRSYIIDSRLELHCVAICFDKDNKVLIAKRCNRKILNDRWECGCAQANPKNTLIESLKEEYEKDFAIEIEPIVYKEREDKEPVPIVMYGIEKGKELHKGIIVLAKIITGKIEINNEKHSEYKMISENEISDLSEEECVSDLKNTLKLAFIRYKELEEN